jgi:SAM-dependent methyltransferase
MDRQELEVSAEKVRPGGAADVRYAAVDWEARYSTGDTPWELGAPSSPLIDLLHAYRERLGGALVPGCGRGDDALYVAGLGAAVTGWDLAPTAIAAARVAVEARGLPATFEVRDALEPYPDALARFDTVVEHTFFCAISPMLRRRYVEAMADLLRPDGLLLGVFLLGDSSHGPPFGATASELRSVLGWRFDMERLEPAHNSPPRWSGRELCIVARRRPDGVAGGGKV